MALVHRAQQGKLRRDGLVGDHSYGRHAVKVRIAFGLLEPVLITRLPEGSFRAS